MAKIYIGNLSFDTTEQGLREAFAPAGEITSVAVIMDRDTGRPRGFAFMEFVNDAAMQKAIEMWDGKELDGRALKVNEAKERKPR